MKKEVNQSKKVEDVTRNYEHPYFVRIEDGDEASIKYYKGQDVPVAHIAFNGCKKHYYAIFNAETQEKADLMNRTYSNWARKDERDKKARQEFELSYEDLAEEGFDPKARRYCRFALDQGVIPIAPHLLFPQFMKEETERELAMFMDIAVLSKCRELWVFGNPTAGMQTEIDYAERKQMMVRYFNEEMEET